MKPEISLVEIKGFMSKNLRSIQKVSGSLTHHQKKIVEIPFARRYKDLKDDFFINFSPDSNNYFLFLKSRLATKRNHYTDHSYFSKGILFYNIQIEELQKSFEVILYHVSYHIK